MSLDTLPVSTQQLEALASRTIADIELFLAQIACGKHGYQVDGIPGAKFHDFDKTGDRLTLAA